MSWLDAVAPIVSIVAAVVAITAHRAARRATEVVQREEKARRELERRLDAATRPPPVPGYGAPAGTSPGDAAAPTWEPDEDRAAPGPPAEAPRPPPAAPPGALPPYGPVPLPRGTPHPVPPSAPPPPLGPEPADERWLRMRFSEPGTGERIAFPFLAPGQSIELAVSIGRESDDVWRADVPFPLDVLPDRDVALTVVVSSSDFEVATLSNEPTSTASGVITLDAATGTSSEFAVMLTAPDEVGEARARVSVFFHGALVQSVLITTSVDRGDVTHVFSAVADYSATQSLRDLLTIPERRRFAILTNDNEDESHQIVVRHDRGLAGPTATFSVREDAVAPLIANLRDEMALNSPERLPSSERQLREALRRLAPLGARLYSSLFPFAREVFLALDREDPASIDIQIARPRSTAFTYPWNFLYTIPLSRDVNIDALPFCPVVDALATGHAELAEHGGRCPHELSTLHEDLLCPFGFWGIRYRIEIPPSRAAVALDLHIPQSAVLAVGLTNRDVDQRALGHHIDRLQAMWAGLHPGISLARSVEKQKLLSLMEPDQPLVYLCCHGDQDGAEVVLGLGGQDRLYTEDLVGLVRRVQQRGSTLWGACPPLVFLNCCGSLAIEPRTLTTYVDGFVGSARASGVIGTEARISQPVAEHVAESILELMIERDATVGDAIQHSRLRLLEQCSLVGLYYTPYAWARLRFLSDGNRMAA